MGSTAFEINVITPTNPPDVGARVVEYTIAPQSLGDNPPATGWRSTTGSITYTVGVSPNDTTYTFPVDIDSSRIRFTGLAPDTAYYVWARLAASGTAAAGTHTRNIVPFWTLTANFANTSSIADAVNALSHTNPPTPWATYAAINPRIRAAQVNGATIGAVGNASTLIDDFYKKISDRIDNDHAFWQAIGNQGALGLSSRQDFTDPTTWEYAIGPMSLVSGPDRFAFIFYVHTWLNQNNRRLGLGNLPGDWALVNPEQELSATGSAFTRYDIVFPIGFTSANSGNNKVMHELIATPSAQFAVVWNHFDCDWTANDDARLYIKYEQYDENTNTTRNDFHHESNLAQSFGGPHELTLSTAMISAIAATTATTPSLAFACDPDATDKIDFAESLIDAGPNRAWLPLEDFDVTDFGGFDHGNRPKGSTNFTGGLVVTSREYTVLVKMEGCTCAD